MTVLMAAVLQILSGIDGIFMGFVNMNHDGAKFAPWDFIFGTLCLTVGIGLVIEAIIRRVMRTR